VAPGLPGWLAVVLGIAAAVPGVRFAQLVIARVAYQPPAVAMRPGWHPLITAIGVFDPDETLAMLIWGRNYLTFPQLSAAGAAHVGAAKISVTMWS